MIRTFITSLSLAAIVAAAPSPARAQSIAEPNTVTVTPFLGVSFGVSNDLDGSLGIGAAVGYDWTRNLGFEFEVARVFDIVGDSDNIDWSLTNISGNVIYHFDTPRVTPYAAFGLGWERSNPTHDSPDPLALADELIALGLDPAELVIGPSSEVAWNFGGGVKMELNDRLLARADLRRFQVNDVAPDHWRLYGGLTFWIKR